MEEYQPQEPDRSLRQKLNRMFSRYDYVGVTNPLKREFTWQVALEQNEIVNMNPGDAMNEERMAQQTGGTFLPGDAATRAQGKTVVVRLQPGERRMIPGEAAYVVAPRLFNALIREKWGTTKPALARLRNPSTQDELIKEIVTGPIINNIGDAMQTYANQQLQNIEGFSDVQVNPPEQKKGFNDPEVLAKAQATRRANQAAKAQAA